MISRFSSKRSEILSRLSLKRGVKKVQNARCGMSKVTTSEVSFEIRNAVGELV